MSKALPNSLQFSVPVDVHGPVGFVNEGYWGNYRLSCITSVMAHLIRYLFSPGIKVNSSWTYDASFYYRFPSATKFIGSLNVGLRTNSGKVLASSETTIRGSQTSWTQVSFKLKPESSASSTDNSFFVTVNGAEAAGETIHFAMFSLFPPTFKGRSNGMRIDIAEVMWSIMRIGHNSLNRLYLLTGASRDGTGFLPFPWRQ